MTRIAWMGVLLTGALSAGCLPNNFVAPDKSAKPAEPARPIDARRWLRLRLLATTGRRRSATLREELDRDMNRAPDAADDTKPDKK